MNKYEKKNFFFRGVHNVKVIAAITHFVKVKLFCFSMGYNHLIILHFSNEIIEKYNRILFYNLC